MNDDTHTTHVHWEMKHPLKTGFLFGVGVALVMPALLLAIAVFLSMVGSV